MNRVMLLGLVACANSAPPPSGDPDAAPSIDAAAPAKPAAPLEVTALGVQGFALTRGRDTVLTAPMFTRQSVFEVGIDAPLPADTQAIDAGLADLPLAQLRAIVTGHAHYDHFIDVAHVLSVAPNATLYANASGKHMLAALAPDRAASCTSPAGAPVIPRGRVVAMDDALASVVDYTNCPSLRPAGAPLEGAWVAVPGSRVRVRALCSTHPDQIGPIHFGAGSIDADLCELPRAASDWLEGATLAFLIDFLGDDGTPEYRVFYQDAPADAPIGQVPAAVLADHRVDLALLCVGSYSAVADHPTTLIGNLDPRFALSGHWEDFFQPLDAAPQPIPFLDLPTYLQRAEAALPGAAPQPLIVDGMPATSRHVLAQPRMQLVVPPAP